MALDAGRWTAPEIVERIRSAHERYRSVLRVKTSGAQHYIRQFLTTAGVPVEAHATGRNKSGPAFGVESLAVELEQGLWIIPDAPATRAWARDLIVYSPSQHAGDRLIASWLAREAARSNKGEDAARSSGGLKHVRARRRRSRSRRMGAREHAAIASAQAVPRSSRARHPRR